MDKNKHLKILIVGSEKKWAIENHFIRYLQHWGCNITSYPAHDIFDDYYHQSVYRKLKVRLRLSHIYRRINNHLLDLIEKQSFDLVWVFKGMEIYPQTLQQIKAKGIKLVNYNPDHPFIHTFRGSGNAYVRESVPFYDAHLCYSLPVLRKIEKEYHIPCAWLPFAYEPTPFELPTIEQEIPKACFIGNPDPFRADIITQLNNQGIPIDLYGNNWEKYVTPSDSLTVNPAIYKADFSRIAPQYRLHLNIFRPHNDNSHNMRTFEMPGLGCIVLAPDSEEHRLLFEPNREIFLYRTDGEMASLAHVILQLPYKKANYVRQAAHQRIIIGGYNYQARAQQVYHWMMQIINGTFTFSSNQFQ